MGDANNTDYQRALDDAQALMDDLGKEIIGGFSIDDEDDGDEVPLNDVDILDDPLSSPLDDTNVHPLHDDFLHVIDHADSSSPKAPPSVTSTATTTSATSPAAAGSMTSMMQGGAGHHPPSLTMQEFKASTDAIKTSTSRFASNLATMAQRAANQVVQNIHQQQSQAMQTTPQSSMMQQQMQTSMMYGHPSPGNLAAVTPTGMQQPNQIIPLELDKEQKAALVATHVGDLLPGESVIMFLANLLHVSDSTGFSYQYNNSTSSTVWCCAMTFYRIILFATAPPSSSAAAPPAGWNAACWPLTPQTQLIQMPLSSMDRVEKSVFSTSSTTTASAPSNMTVMGLVLYGKDNGRHVRFTTPSYADTIRAHEALMTYAFPGRRNLGYLFAFESKRQDVMASIVTDEATGKGVITLESTRRRFDGVVEFQRQLKMDANGKSAAPWAIWPTVNQSYQTCASYPSILAGPASLNEHMMDGQRLIRQCAAFRSESRLPALTWSSGIDGASLWRASQPKIGLQGNRSPADELFLKHIVDSAASANAMAMNHQTQLSLSSIIMLTGSTDVTNWIPPQEITPGYCLKILDLRPRSSAMANRTGGYGYENTSNYPGTTLQFCNIGNIHAVRDSYQKLSAICTSSSTSDIQWQASVEDTKWLSSVRLILAASWEAAFWIHVHRLPVFLHCSHGWDRTSQVAVLAQLLLDPFYRTMEGFSVVVEKDFMSFGHPFHTRCAHGEGRGESGATNTSSSSDEGQISPIFIQFLDCVFQLVNQYPECFEFNAKYLLVLSEHVYSCRFGSFLCDTERERELAAGIRQRTHCVWEYLESRDDLRNKSFCSQRADGVVLMPLATLMRNVTLWVDRHCMYGPKPTVRSLPVGVTLDEGRFPPLHENEKTPFLTTFESQAILSDLKPMEGKADDSTISSKVETESSKLDETSPANNP